MFNSASADVVQALRNQRQEGVAQCTPAHVSAKQQDMHAKGTGQHSSKYTDMATCTPLPIRTRLNLELARSRQFYSWRRSPECPACKGSHALNLGDDYASMPRTPFYSRLHRPQFTPATVTIPNHSHGRILSGALVVDVRWVKAWMS